MFNKFYVFVPSALETSAPLEKVQAYNNDERQRLVENAQAIFNDTSASDDSQFALKKCA